MVGDILYSFLKALRKERDTIQSASFFFVCLPYTILPIGSMYGIFTYIYHQYHTWILWVTVWSWYEKNIFQPTKTPRNGPLFLFAASSARRNVTDASWGNFGPSEKPPIASRGWEPVFWEFGKHILPWEPTTFIFRGYNPYFEGLKPSCFMVLGSKGGWWFQLHLKKIRQSGASSANRGWNPTQLCRDYFINHEITVRPWK